MVTSVAGIPACPFDEETLPGTPARAGMRPNKGEIKAEIVVNCAGLWGRKVGKMAGVNVPLQAAEHYYLLTEPIEGVHPDLPIIEDFEHYTYIREDVGGLMVGFFEPVAAPWGVNGIPKDFAFGEINPDWDRMMPYVDIAMERVPMLKEAGIRKFFCGPLRRQPLPFNRAIPQDRQQIGQDPFP